MTVPLIVILIIAVLVGMVIHWRRILRSRKAQFDGVELTDHKTVPVVINR